MGPYRNQGPVDAGVEPATSKLAGKSVIVTGGQYADGQKKKLRFSSVSLTLYRGKWPRRSICSSICSCWVCTLLKDIITLCGFKLSCITLRPIYNNLHQVPMSQSRILPTLTRRKLWKSWASEFGFTDPASDQCLRLTCFRDCQFVHCDVRSWQDQVNVFKQAIGNSPSKSVDIVIANAGISGADQVFWDGKLCAAGKSIPYLSC